MNCGRPSTTHPILERATAIYPELGRPTYDEATNSFETPPDQAVLAFFPIDGIFTRIINVLPPSPAPNFPLKYIETSSPGLRGQSGGPTFDTEGAVWAIQSQTRHLPLGFSPEIKVAGKLEQEHPHVI
jgi:hypothetical protein